MAVRVTLRLQQADLPGLVDTDETVRHRRGAHGVDGRGQAAVGAIFKAYRHGKTRGHFAVRLRFRGSRADGGPAEQIPKVLRAVGIQRFRRQRQSHIHELDQQTTRNLQAAFNIKRTIHMRVVNQPLPADGSTGFFKIDAHHQIEAIADLCGKGFKPTSIFDRSFRIVNGARTANHQQARIAAGDDIGDGFTGVRDLRFLFNAQGEFRLQLLRGH